MLLTVKSAGWKRLVFVLALLFFLQALTLLHWHHESVKKRNSLHTAAVLHASTAAYPSPADTEYAFGSKGRKVAALAELAQHYVDNPSLPYTRLDEAIRQEFPWWVPEKLSYIPWRSTIRSQSWETIFGWNTTGLVICAGDGQAWEAAHLISTLRNVINSKLPIEVAYAGDQDLSPTTREFLANTSSEVHFVDLTQIFDDHVVGLSGWAMKSFAIVASRFARTILVDADTVFFFAPDTIFSTYPGLRETGALFFHDRFTTSSWSYKAPARRGWVAAELIATQRAASVHLNTSSLFYREYTTEEADSAMVVIDKSQAKLYLATLFAAWMNTKYIRDFTYDMFHGDKETYWLATELSGATYSFEPWSAAIMAEDDSSESIAEHLGKKCTEHMAHATADGTEPFWANGAIWKDIKRKDLSFVNWTHWFLGSRIDEVLNTGQTQSNEERKPDISSTQPVWDGWGTLETCPQHDESRWRVLSPRFNKTLAALLAEAEAVNERYSRQLSRS